MSVRSFERYAASSIAGFFAFTVFFVGAPAARAITLDNTRYGYADPIYSTAASNNSILMYDVSTGLSIYSHPNVSLNENLAWGGQGNFSVVEVTSDICGGGNLTYDQCKRESAFVEEFLFTVVGQDTVGGGPAVAQQGSGALPVIPYTPQVTITFPLKGTVFGHAGSISYQATDQNDNGPEHEKNSDGFISAPVSLFYSDKVADWYGSLVPPSFKYQIATGLPAIGKYLWSIQSLVPGTFYRIVADALDARGLVGEDISPVFTVSFDAPVFKVKADPAVVRKGNVIISVSSSEDLDSPPTVTVTQSGGPSTPVAMQGSGSAYQGTYAVLSGYDGTANIAVSGSSLAGNVGSTTIDGGTFSVGVNPPPKPRITEPSNNASLSQDFIDIKGTAQNNTILHLKVNGAEIASSQTDPSGAFSFKKVPLEKVKNQGVNFISVVARDPLGATSEPANIKIKRNIAPTVSISKPQAGQTISDSALVVLSAADANSDTLLFTYQLAPFKGAGSAISEKEWMSIAEAVTDSGFAWNAAEADDGDYLLRAIADDGTARSTSTPVRITVKNTLPFFRFEDGRKTITKNQSVSVSGRVMIPSGLSVAPAIVSVEYSLDTKKWLPVSFSYGDLSSGGGRFSVPFNDLKEGTHPISWRVKDTRGLYGKIVHNIIVDQTAPKAPSISAPESGATLTLSEDENQDKAGMQTTVSGTAEPFSSVSIINDGAKATVKALPDGKFAFPGVTLTGRGKHSLSLYATDEAGNQGVARDLSLIYNNPPAITFISPKPSHGISGKTKLVWRIEDADADPIVKATVSYRKGDGRYRDIVTNAEATSSVIWDVTSFPEGNDYELRISATDGLTPASEVSSFSIDKTPPTLESLVFDSEASKKSGLMTFSGTARDSASGVEYVEYSLGQDDSWYKALITRGYLGRQASYSIKHKTTIADGSYTVRVRAVDSAGNVSSELLKLARIDATAPRIGSFFIRSSAVNLYPDQEGALSIPRGTASLFAVSLEGDTKSATLFTGGQQLALRKNVASGLWESSLELSIATASPLMLTAEDNDGNAISKKEIGRVEAIEPGSVSYVDGKETTQPLSNASIRVLKYDKETERSALFAETSTDNAGHYTLALPGGSYRVIESKPGFKTLSFSIALAQPKFIASSFATYEIPAFEGWLQKIIDWLRY